MKVIECVSVTFLVIFPAVAIPASILDTPPCLRFLAPSRWPTDD